MIAPPPWLAEPEVARVFALLRDVRFVGGCVRDLLLNRPVSDLDLATPLEPEEASRTLSVAGMRVIPTGLAHGTVTVLAGQRHLEITTLRRDVETDGRHATVAFTDSWAEDAARRDFTINALFLSDDGTLTDTVGGLADLDRGRVRFIGDPDRRIGEDVLRILRFYRFQAGYGRGEADQAARAACAKQAHSIERLSGERVRTELLKLLALPDPAATVALMAEDCVLAAILRFEPRLDVFGRMLRLDPDADPLRRLAALAGGDLGELAERLRLSAAQQRRLRQMEGHIELGLEALALRASLHEAGPQQICDRALLTAAREGSEVAADAARRVLAEASTWQPASFPLGGRDLALLGLQPGPAFGQLLRELEGWWLAEDRGPGRAECLAELRRRVGQPDG